VAEAKKERGFAERTNQSLVKSKWHGASEARKAGRQIEAKMVRSSEWPA